MSTAHASSRRRWPPLLLAATLLAALPAGAAMRPAGNVYFTVFVGLDDAYGARTECFEFDPDRLCTLDGMICGAWREIARRPHEIDVEFELTGVAGAGLLRLSGLGMIENRGRRSSLAGDGVATPLDGAGPGANFSFAAREVGRERCLTLLDESAGPDDPEQIVGSGVIVSETREVGEFHALVASGVGLIEVRHGATESLRITADDNILPILTSETANGRLLLGASAPFSSHDNPRYEITVRSLDELSLTGVLGADVTGLDTARFTVDIRGVSRATVAGRAEHQQIVLSGVSRYEARHLASRSVSIDITGPSSAVVSVSDRLDGSCTGGATLEYIGNPTVTVDVDRLSTLRRID